MSRVGFGTPSYSTLRSRDGPQIIGTFKACGRPVFTGEEFLGPAADQHATCPRSASE